MVLNQEWDKVWQYLEENENPNDDVLYYCDEGGWNVLHWAIWNSAEDKIQIRLMEKGGKALVHKQTKLHHFLPVHLIGSTISLEVAKKMVEVGGNDILLAKDRRGNLPIYYARKFLSRDDVIDYFNQAKPGFKDKENIDRQATPRDFKNPVVLDQDLYHDIHELKYLYKTGQSI
jgi:ankyrin repeat protein